jgi:glycosyltransferase involved in cell wall biosynthesis
MTGLGRVLVVLHENGLGGASRAVLRIVPLLEELGWEFAFWTPLPGPAEAELEARGYLHAGAPRLLRYSWRSLTEPPGLLARVRTVPGYLRTFRRWVGIQSPTLVHANSLVTLPEAVAARRSGRGTLVHAHEMLPPGPRGAVAARLLHAAADAVVVPSQAAAASLRGANVHARVVYNGVRIPEAPPGPRAGGRPLVVGTLATVSRRKGSDLFLAAVDRVRQTHPEVEFRMIGGCAPGPERDWARAVVESARRSGVVCSAGGDVSAELAEWDLFVLPSREDPFPLAVLEAMAAGVPVLATRVGGVPEQVTPDTGVLVDPDNADAVAAGILDLGRQPELRAAMGAAGRRRVAREFTLERQAEDLHQAYLATVAASGRER